MRHEYVADVGDWGKYGLLRLLQRSGFSLSVAWYLNTEREISKDGRLRAYLDNRQKFGPVDAELFNCLIELNTAKPLSVSAVEESRILEPGTKFFSVAVNEVNRNAFRRKLLLESAASDLVFLDADNGLAEADCPPRKLHKHASIDEVESLLEMGRSLLIYQHGVRHLGKAAQQAQWWRARIAPLVPENGMLDIFSFHRYQFRFYLLITQAKHLHLREKFLFSFRQSQWTTAKHFREVEVAFAKGTT